MIVFTGRMNRWLMLRDSPRSGRETHTIEMEFFRPAGLPVWTGLRCCVILEALRVRLPDSTIALQCLRIETDPQVVRAMGPVACDFHVHPASGDAVIFEGKGEGVQLDSILLLGKPIDDEIPIGEIIVADSSRGETSWIFGHSRRITTKPQRTQRGKLREEEACGLRAPLFGK